MSEANTRAHDQHFLGAWKIGVPGSRPAALPIMASIGFTHALALEVVDRGIR
jgi:hypothetical protein